MGSFIPYNRMGKRGRGFLENKRSAFGRQVTLNSFYGTTEAVPSRSRQDQDPPVVRPGVYTPITPTNSFTASALLLSPACSSGVSLI